MQSTSIGTQVGSVFGQAVNEGVNFIPQSTSIRPPEEGLSRSLNYYADFSGCGHWRMIWPEMMLNGYQQCIVHGSTTMILDPRFYEKVSTVRVQRQASPSQIGFIQFLKQIQSRYNFNLIYEIDDVLFYEDIPEYNRFRSAFSKDEVRDAAMQIMQMCDEVTVTCDYMKNYYAEKTGHKNITVIPNYMPRFWMDGYYDEKQLSISYDKNIKKRKRPRVLWSGSGAHFDTTKCNQPDDFNHIIDVVKKTKKKYQWVFLGAFPLELTPLVRSGEIEFHKWAPIYEYPRTLNALKTNISVAPLQDNPFNNSKSDIKYIEGCAFGKPVICQDISTYKNAPFRFQTGEEMVDQIDSVLRDKDTYLKACRKAREVAGTRWLECNIKKYAELYQFPYGDPQRVQLHEINDMSPKLGDVTEWQL